jgi:hypothetical protein
MAKKVISYKLNADGTIPDYVEDGGYLAKDPNDTPNMVVLGISKDGADISGAVAEFADQSSAVSYVQTYLSDSTWIEEPMGVERTFIVTDAVANLFAKLA